jgi:hypothetical protein
MTEAGSNLLGLRSLHTLLGLIFLQSFLRYVASFKKHCMHQARTC